LGGPDFEFASPLQGQAGVVGEKSDNINELTNRRIRDPYPEVSEVV